MSFQKRVAQVGFVVWCTVGVVCAQQTPQDAPPQTGLPTATLHTGTQLVVLDATVLDKAGKVVTQQLGRDDFQIEEDKQSQEIRSFESAAEHAVAVANGDMQKSPLLIFVLDELNYAYVVPQTSSWNVMNQMSQYAYERLELLAYLRAQPAQLNGLTEVLVLTHHGYQILAQPSRDRDMIADRVNRHNPGLGSPFRDFIEETGYGGSADFTLTKDSMQAMWSLALQQRSVPGRKIVFWLGQGGPNQLSSELHRTKHLVSSQRYVREITDLLVDARITLYIMGPGVGGAGTPNGSNIAREASTYNFESDFGFSGYVRATGGQWSNGNDIRGEIQASATISSVYYTISYRPSKADFDGNFRRIKITVVGHPEWTVLTKAGYYAMRFGGEKDEEHQLQTDLSIATFEAMSFSAIGMDLVKIERIKGADAVRFTFQLESDDLQWHTDTTKGLRKADVTVSSAALGSVFENNALSSHSGTWKLTTPVTSAKETLLTTVTLTAHVPAKTQRLRFVARDMANGRMGSRMDLNRAALVGTPEIEPPTPALQPRTVAAQR